VLVATFAMQTTSMGMFGAVPAAMGVVAMAGRLQVTRAVHGVVIMCLCIAGMIVPLLTFANYTVRDGMITILPLMHEFPRTPTLAFIILGVAGAMAVAVLYGRLATNELMRAEERVHFQAWQLQQLLPPA
jgi:hypothetical protein